MTNPKLPDDYPEIVYANSKGPSPQQSTLYNNANGSFSSTPKLNFRIGTAMGVNHKDVNSDGYPDIIYPVFRNGTYFNATSRIFFGGQNGIDNTTYMGIETLGAYDVAIDDLNNDGYQDLVFACHQNFSNYEIMSMAYYGGPSGFNTIPDELFNTSGAGAVATGDFNKDGRKDIVFACERNQTTGNIGSQAYFGSPSGFNTNADVLLPTQAGFGVAVADINLDGWLDIVFANNRNTSLTAPNDILITSPVYFGGPTGFNSAPDVNLDTSGAMDVAVTDLDLDGWPDIIFANYADGLTTRTYSYAYFGSPSGFDSHTPGAWFKTAWAFGVDVGDFNLDGNPDVAFANYFDGATYAINSTIFAGPCYGQEPTPAVTLPTIGATEVVIADVDRYYMSTDRNPPTITPGSAEGRYVVNGTYTSPDITVDEKVLSANATWTATIPAQPAGGDVSVYLSNNGGAGWTKAVKGQQMNFTTEGKTLKFRVELVSDLFNVETPVFQDITIIYEKESFPHNLTLDVNSDGKDEWSWPGKFNRTVTLNESTMGLATILMGVVPRTGTGNFTVPLKFTSDAPGILRVYGLNITGNFRPEAVLSLPKIFMTENVPLPDVFNINNFFRHQDEDRLVYSTHGNWNVFMNISENGSVSFTSRAGWYGEERFVVRATDMAGEYADLPVEVEVRHVLQPPVFTGVLPAINVMEGDTVRSAFNLFDFVADPDTPKTALIFSLADITNGNISVDMDINQNVNIYSKAGWYGNASVKMKVSDGELSAYASFNVRVEHRPQPPPANQPPSLATLPPIQLLESSQLEHAFNLFNFTTDPDSPRSNLTFKIEENSNPNAGVSIDADGWVSIRPENKWSGISLVVINVSDGQYSAKSSFTVTVTAKSVAPVAEKDGTLLFAVYGLIALMMVLLVLVGVDIAYRARKKHVVRPQELSETGPKEPKKPAAAAPKQTPAPPPRQLAVPYGEEARPSWEAPSIPSGAEAEAPAVPAEEFPGESKEAGEPVGTESPPESVPDMTPQTIAAPQEGGAPSEQATAPEIPVSSWSMAAPEAPASSEAQGVSEAPTVPETPGGVEAPSVLDAGATSESPDASAAAFDAVQPPSEQAPAGESELKLSGRSAALLLAELQNAKTDVDTPEAPPPAPGPESSLPQVPEVPRPARRAPATELDAQEVGQEPGLSTEPEPAGELQVAEGIAGEGRPGAEGPVGGGPAPEGQAGEGPQAHKPITRVRCAGCKAAIPIFSAQRPLVVTCPQCGRMGMLK
jgi:hypothetical protein